MEQQLTTPFMGVHFNRQVMFAAMIGAACIVVATDTASAMRSQDLESLRAEYFQQLGAHRYADAERTARQILLLVERSVGTSPDALINALHSLAITYMWQGRFDEAIQLYQRAQRTAERELPPDNPALWMSVNMLADAYMQQGLHFDAESYAKQAIRIAEQNFPTSHPALATSLATLGKLYRDERRFDQAEPLMLRSLDVARNNFPPEHLAVTMTLVQTAQLYAQMQQPAESERYFKQALRNLKKTPDTTAPVLETVLAGLAQGRMQQHRPEEAEPYFRRALQVAEKLHGTDSAEASTNLRMLAAVYLMTDRTSEADNLFRRALDIDRRAIGSSRLALSDSIAGMATVLLAQNRLADAAEYFGRSFAVMKEAVGPNDPCLETPLAIGAMLMTAVEKWDDAEELIDRAIALARTDQGLHLDHTIRARIRWMKGDRSGALEDAHRAIELAESVRTAAAGTEFDVARLFGDFADAYELVVEFQTQLGNVSDAFAAAESSRARSLIDQLSLQGVSAVAGLPEHEAETFRDRYRTVRLQLTRTVKQLQMLDQRQDISSAEKDRVRETLKADGTRFNMELIEVVRDIHNANPAYRQMLSRDNRPASLETIQKWVADQKALLLQYVIGHDGAYCFVVSGDSAPRLEMLTAADTESKSLGIPSGRLNSERLTAAMTIDGAPLSHALSRHVVADDVSARLAAACKTLIPKRERQALQDGQYHTLIVVPDGPLSFVPFECLVVKPNDDGITYLLDVGPPVLYGPSATVLYNLAAQRHVTNRSTASPVLTVGDPAYDSQQDEQDNGDSVLDRISLQSRYWSVGGPLRRLPYSAWESTWVAEVFREEDIGVTRLVQAEATEINVREAMADRRMVHLACHGLASREHGNFLGALAFTPGNGDDTDPDNDGFLTLSEIYNLNLRGCELAILSACETNFGPRQKGEGVWALSRGFLVAGARRVVASNWLVDDEAAASLISYFCSSLAQAQSNGEEPDYATALHEAKKWVRDQEKWKSPYYWATFVLVGPGKTIQTN